MLKGSKQSYHRCREQRFHGSMFRVKLEKTLETSNVLR